jgi:hypothetical protein
MTDTAEDSWAGCGDAVGVGVSATGVGAGADGG